MIFLIFSCVSTSFFPAHVYFAFQISVSIIVNNLLTPPGAIQLLSIQAKYFAPEYNDVVELFQVSGWDLTNLTTSDSMLTIFAPPNVFSGDDNTTLVHLMNATWIQHNWDFLRHIMMEPAYTIEEMVNIAKDNGGSMTVSMSSGSTGELSLEGLESINRSTTTVDMRGVDG